MLAASALQLLATVGPHEASSSGPGQANLLPAAVATPAPAAPGDPQPVSHENGPRSTFPTVSHLVNFSNVSIFSSLSPSLCQSAGTWPPPYGATWHRQMANPSAPSRTNRSGLRVVKQV